MDHVLNGIQEQIKMCFCMLGDTEISEIDERYEFKSAKALLTAYNKIAKLYYEEEYHIYYKPSIKRELLEFRDLQKKSNKKPKGIFK